jgi:hypothetical protein
MALLSSASVRCSGHVGRREDRRGEGELVGLCRDGKLWWECVHVRGASRDIQQVRLSASLVSHERRAEVWVGRSVVATKRYAEVWAR